MGAGAVDHQPQRYVGVVEKAVDEVGRIHRGGNERYHRHAVEHYADGAWDEPPGTLVVEVEHIDVEREHLSHQDHERLVDVLHHGSVIGVSVHKGDDPSDQRNVSYNRKLLGILCHVRYLLTDLEPGSFAVHDHHTTGTVTFVSHKRQSVMSTSGVI